MKVGLVTTQYSPNYGALLQAYSLQEYMRTVLGHDVHIIDYYPPHADSFWSLYPKGSGARHFARNACLFINRRIVKGKKRRLQNDKRFVDEYLRCTTRCRSEEDILALGQFDAYVCGSDQIWNLTRHNDPNWFLYFTRTLPGVLKIAYAPSVADPIPNDAKGDVKRYLSNLDAISVREAEDVRQIQPLTDKPVIDVCDPVFLRDSQEWSDFAVTKEKGAPFILCYFISPDDLAVRAVEAVRRLTGLRVVHLNVNVRDKFQSDTNILDADPREFIGLIRDAEIVCTNSFHASAFSIMFCKNLMIVPKRSANRRMENLLYHAGLPDLFMSKRKIETLTVGDIETDYSSCSGFLDAWVEASKSYLTRSLS